MSFATGRTMRLLLDLRPALEGFSGIPQETRLLFKHLHRPPELEMAGLIQSPHRVLAKGLPLRPDKAERLPAHKRKRRLARMIVSLLERPGHRGRYLASVLRAKLRAEFGGAVPLSAFDPDGFEDFIWRSIFSKSLGAEDRRDIVGREFRIASDPWHALYYGGRRWVTPRPPAYPALDTRGYDVFIGQKPFAARTAPGTAQVIRYHDAMPVFMPQVIPEKALHLATHIDPLADNVRSGAWFCCISDATRRDLLTMFPDAEPRAETVHNIVSPAYHDRPERRERVAAIIRTRLYEECDWLPSFSTLSAKRDFYAAALPSGMRGRGFPYLLMVSTIEPRKNHQRLVAAWERLRSAGHDKLKLVVVGSMGWDNAAIRESFRPWLESGDLFMLAGVPATDLRVLYQHAEATVCPSLGEGFDYSGVEAMRSGGIVVSSDLPVHREVYDDASLYFDPYSTKDLTDTLERLLGRRGKPLRETLRTRGAEVGARYTPSRLLPQWQAFLQRACADRPR